MSLVLLPPSNWKVVWSTTVPATLPSGLIPACSVKNVLVSRAMLGSEFSAMPLTVLPTVALSVCNSTPVVATSMVWLSDPTFRTALLVDTCPTSTTSPAMTALANPCLVIVMSYLPGFTLTKMYLPALLVVVVRVCPVEVSFRTTAASGSTALVESVTVPLTVPNVVVCANTGNAVQHSSTADSKAAANRNRLHVRIVLPPSKMPSSERKEDSRRATSPVVSYLEPNLRRGVTRHLPPDYVA